MTDRLFCAPRPGADLLIRGAQVLDPRGELDEPRDILIRDGHISEIAPPESIAPGDRMDVVPAAGKHLFPGFVDPHVHLRTPGQEHKEDLDTGTAAAASDSVEVHFDPNKCAASYARETKRKRVAFTDFQVRRARHFTFTVKLPIPAPQGDKPGHHACAYLLHVSGASIKPVASASATY